MQLKPRMITAGAISIVAFALVAVGLLASPATAGDNGAIQFDGVARGTNECAGQTDVVALDMYEGNLIGCLINTGFDDPRITPSGVYLERGTETFVGCLYEDGVEIGCGSFDTTYLFSGKFPPDGEQQFGRCQHPIVAGTGTGVFEGATGRIDFKDDLDAGLFNFRGHVSLG